MLTLGYVVTDWIEASLPSPSDPTRPFILSDEQARFVLKYYAVDERGRFIYRRAALQEAKGWGKSPLLAALNLAEFTAPVLFDGFDAAGRPVGRPWGTGGAPAPWVQVAASSVDQAHSNVYALIWELLSVNGGRAAEDLGIDEGRSRLFLKSQPGAKLEPVTSSSPSRSGQRLTFATLDETHLWTRESGGHKLAKTILANASKMGGRTIECSNAPELGAESVAELTERAYRNREPGILFAAHRPSVEPKSDMPNRELLKALKQVYKGAPWVPLDRILLDLRDPATGWEEGCRVFLNVPGAGVGALVDPDRWAELATDTELEPGSRVALGFSAPRDDMAALVGCSEGRLYLVAMWTDEDVDRSDVSATIEKVFNTYAVSKFFVDKRMWRSEAEQWERIYGPRVMDFPITPVRMTPVIERFLAGVGQGSVHHEPDEDLDRHFAAARLRTRQGRMMLESPDGRPIDLVVASMLAHEAWAQAPEPVRRGWRDYVMDLREEGQDGEKTA